MKLNEVIRKIEEGKNQMEFLPTGFIDLDHYLDGGLMRKELVVLGGATGIGKSYVAGQIMYNIASKGFKTAYFSLEISNEMVVSRLIGSIANIGPTRINAGKLYPNEQEDVERAENKVLLYEDNMEFIDDVYNFEFLKKVVKESAYDFIVIDFIQNVEVPGVPDEYSRLTQVARQLQMVAKEKDCCILALSQLSNVVANQDVNKGVTEYRGSGAIAHACDLGFFITRGVAVYDTQEVNLCLKKNRRGRSGQSFDLLFKSPGGWITQKER